jgi:hypothetical protein
MQPLIFLSPGRRAIQDTGRHAVSHAMAMPR